MDDNRSKYSGGGFTDRYVLPDGELTGSGRIITEIQEAGLEVPHDFKSNDQKLSMSLGEAA